MNPEQALQNLIVIANAALLNAADRNAINQSIQAIAELIKKASAAPVASASD